MSDLSRLELVIEQADRAIDFGSKHSAEYHLVMDFNAYKILMENGHLEKIPLSKGQVIKDNDKGLDEYEVVDGYKQLKDKDLSYHQIFAYYKGVIAVQDIFYTGPDDYLTYDVYSVPYPASHYLD